MTANDLYKMADYQLRERQKALSATREHLATLEREAKLLSIRVAEEADSLGRLRHAVETMHALILETK